MLLYLLFMIVLVLLIASFTINKFDFLSPSVIMTFMFSISIFFALLFKDKWSIDFQAETFFVIIIGLITAILVDSFFCNANNREMPYDYKYDSQLIHVDSLLLIVMSVIGILSVALFYRDVVNVVIGYGYDTDNMFETYRLIKNGRLTSLTGNTPSTGFIVNQLFKLSWASAYVSCFCLANNFNTDEKFHQIGLHLIIVVTALCLGIVEGARGGILQLLAAFFFDYFICLKREKGWNNSLMIPALILVVFSVLCVAPLFYLSTKIIGGESSKTLFEYIAFYVGGSIDLLNLYVLNPIPLTDFFSENETFIGMTNLLAQLGFPVEIKSVSLEFRTLQGGFNGNVYTFFRRPLHDFGFCGMILCVALTISFFSWIYHGKIKYNDSKTSNYWILFYSPFVYWMVVSSIENYCFSLSLNWLLQIAIMVMLYFIYKNIRICHGKIYIQRFC